MRLYASERSGMLFLPYLYVKSCKLEALASYPMPMFLSPSCAHQLMNHNPPSNPFTLLFPSLHDLPFRLYHHVLYPRLCPLFVRLPSLYIRPVDPVADPSPNR